MHSRLTDIYRNVKSNLMDSYDGASIFIRRKVGILYWIFLFSIVLFSFFVYLNLNHEPQYVRTAVIDGVIVVLICLSFYFLYLGYYRSVINVFVICIVILWIYLYYVNIEYYMDNRTIVHYPFLFVILTFVSFFGSKRLMVAVSLILVITNMVIFFILESMKDSIFEYEYYRALNLNTLFGIIIVAVILYLFSSTTNESLHHLEKELAANRELTANLENKVKERTKQIEHAMEEVNVINDNLVQSNRELSKARETMNRDIRMAVNVQKTFLQQECPLSQYWDVAFTYRPMMEVSGDFYDFYSEEGHLKGVSLFDVSGHGIASGLVTMVAKSIAFRNFSDFMAADLGRMMRRINEDLIREIGDVDHYVTGIVTAFHRNQVEYVNAGHPEIIKLDGETGRATLIRPENDRIMGPFLGITFIKERYSSIIFPVKKNDVLLLYSDALVENLNKMEEPFGKERLLKTLESSPVHEGADKILDYILGIFMDFVGTEQLMDDLTAIILKRNMDV